MDVKNVGGGGWAHIFLGPDKMRGGGGMPKCFINLKISPNLLRNIMLSFFTLCIEYPIILPIVDHKMSRSKHKSKPSSCKKTPEFHVCQSIL